MTAFYFMFITSTPLRLSRAIGLSHHNGISQAAAVVVGDILALTLWCSLLLQERMFYRWCIAGEILNIHFVKR